MGNIGAAAQLEHFHGHMRRTARTAAAVIELAWIGLRPRDQITHAAIRRIGRHEDHIRHPDHQANGRQILGLERHARAPQRIIDRSGGDGAHHERIAIGF